MNTCNDCYFDGVADVMCDLHFAELNEQQVQRLICKPVKVVESKKIMLDIEGEQPVEFEYDVVHWNPHNY